MANFQYNIAEFTEEEMTTDNLNAWGEIGWRLVSNQLIFKDKKDLNRLVFQYDMEGGARKYQYYFEDIAEADMTVDMLNNWGANGWELVSNLSEIDLEGEVNHLIFMNLIVEPVAEQG